MIESPNAPQLLDNAINAFANRVAEIEFQRFTAISHFKTQHAATKQLDEALTKRSVEGTAAVMGSSTYFIDLAANASLLDMTTPGIDYIPLRGRIATRSELLTNLCEWLDRQLAWLLVDTVEAYDRFLKDIYSTLGYLDPTAWPARHGNREVSKLARLWGAFQSLSGRHRNPRRNHEWYAERTRIIARQNCEPILKQLRQLIPDLKKYEATSWTVKEADVAFWRAIAELFRHVIVHQNRQAKPDEFWASAQKKTGRSLGGKKEGVVRLRNSVQQLLTPHEGTLKIALVDRNHVDHDHLPPVDKRFTKLFECVVNHGFLIYRLVTVHCREAPYWLRIAVPK